ncbi:neuroguidin [Harmonia axyridis]|uniref:neuroguidin n=1 Tax=Harmonia axyridis TaxID=115357 RepID=UPI001E279814|nr:neuroguidin [Harmonia axyridis]
METTEDLSLDQDVPEPNQDLQATLSLLDEINTSTENVTQLVDNMIRKVKNGELSTDQGLSFLEMKNMMLLSYLINITYFNSLKCSGKKIENDICIDRLIEIRTVLEKIRPIDQKLKFQIERLVKSSRDGISMDDSKKHKANVGNAENLDDNDDEDIESDDDQESGDGEESVPKSKKGIYVPPKLSAVHYPGDENAHERNRRLQEKSKKHALSSALLQDLCEEYLDTPLELHQSSRAQQILTKQQKERQEYEEEYMTRLPVSKSEKHDRRKLTTLGVLGSEITNYGDSKSVNKKKRKYTPKGKGKSSKRKKFSH